MFGPNITGNIVPCAYKDLYNQSSGALYGSGSSDQAYGSGLVGNAGFRIYLDASRSSSTYGGSPSVQPSAVRLLPCLKS